MNYFCSHSLTQYIASIAFKNSSTIGNLKREKGGHMSVMWVATCCDFKGDEVWKIQLMRGGEGERVASIFFIPQGLFSLLRDH